MPNKNLVSWSAIISGSYQSGDHYLALNLFSQIQLEPNEYIYATVISACAALSALPQGKQFHARSLKSGYESVSFVANSLISMYMNFNMVNDALLIFSTEPKINSVVSYNAMIMGFKENLQPLRGLEVFKVMNRRGVLPDQFTFVGVFGICSEMEDLWRGIELHCTTIKLGLDTMAFVGNVVLTMYSKCNSVKEAVKVFVSIEEKDMVSWNTIITACCHCGDYAMGLKFFGQMFFQDKGLGVKFDNFTLASALAACAGSASIRHGGQIHAHIIRTRLGFDSGVGNALVNMYAKCGSIGYASSIFDCMVNRNLVSWNTILAAFGNHGYGTRAIKIFEQMRQCNVKPDSVTFIGLLAACNHAGLVDEGRSYFNAMKEIFRIAPEIEHFSCLIDLLGRAGRLEEAKEYLQKFPFGTDLVVLGSLLSACRLHGDVVVGEWVGCRLLELQPDTSSPFVLLSNLYASDEQWSSVAEARKRLKGSGVKKEPGHSLIEVKGNVEKFTVGDFSHPRMKEMKDILRSFSWKESELSFQM
ncbi:hypothetical protein GIB67_022712 [Kingdonia uniflora]|uniref:Pentatricopeptide repeat-containing protein n=1 Tax=Kingdonia uniflora TaxID=39325 RepID=A0A7J7P8P6_9MAGN|nr:hypothetical protein GIB67_022712 [Kingdonia uniflora]